MTTTAKRPSVVKSAAESVSLRRKKRAKSPTKPSRNIKRRRRTHLLIALTPYLKTPGAILWLNLTAVASVTWKPFHAATVHNTDTRKFTAFASEASDGRPQLKF